jgi:hypothetical protein
LPPLSRWISQRRHEHAGVERPDPLLHPEQRGPDVDAQALLVVEPAELGAERLRHLGADELDRRLERVPQP